MYVCVCVHVVYVDVSMYCMYVYIDKHIHIWVIYVYAKWCGHILPDYPSLAWDLCCNLKGIIWKLFVHNMHNGGYGIHYGSAHRRAPWNSTDEKSILVFLFILILLMWWRLHIWSVLLTCTESPRRHEYRFYCNLDFINDIVCMLLVYVILLYTSILSMQNMYHCPGQ